MISAVVLTHNDEKTVARTLESLAWCKDTVVVDDFSTDNTTSVLRKFPVRAFQRHLADDFASQRNFGLSKAKGEWVIFIDSDEVVSAALAKEIRERTSEESCDGYYLKRKDFLLGKWLTHGETNAVRLLRLAKKDKGTWVRPVHEVWEVVGNICELEEPILHYPHPNVAQFIDEINRYSTVNAKFLHDTHVRGSLWQILAYPSAKFFVNYILRLGFLDGTAGAVVAFLMSFHSFLTRAKLYLLDHRHE